MRTLGFTKLFCPNLAPLLKPPFLWSQANIQSSGWYKSFGKGIGLSLSVDFHSILEITLATCPFFFSNLRDKSTDLELIKKHPRRGTLSSRLIPRFIPDTKGLPHQILFFVLKGIKDNSKFPALSSWSCYVYVNERQVSPSPKLWGIFQNEKAKADGEFRTLSAINWTPPSRLM